MPACRSAPWAISSPPCHHWAASHVGAWQRLPTYPCGRSSFRGGATTISGRVSSQFTSSLVINAIRAEVDTVITIVDDLISKP